MAKNGGSGGNVGLSISSMQGIWENKYKESQLEDVSLLIKENESNHFSSFFPIDIYI